MEVLAPEVALVGAVGRGSLADALRIIDAEPMAVQVSCGTMVRRTALMMAAEKASLDMVKLLLDRGAPVWYGDGEGRTALHLAAMAGREETVVELLNRGANALQRDRHGWNPLMSASFHGRVMVVRQLLCWRRKAERRSRSPAPHNWVDESEPMGWTALALACFQGHVEVAKTLLVEGGANPHKLTVDGMTARTLAYFHGCPHTAAVIEWYERETTHPALLRKARVIRDVTLLADRYPSELPPQALIPACLTTRLAEAIPLPTVVVGEGAGGGLVAEVAGFVVRDLHAELLEELVGYMAPAVTV